MERDEDLIESYAPDVDDGAAPVEQSRNSESLDEEDNTLRPGFVRRVAEALEEGDDETVYNLVEPLHPADIADLSS